MDAARTAYLFDPNDNNSIEEVMVESHLQNLPFKNKDSV